MSERVLSIAADRAQELRIELIKNYCQTPEDCLAVTSALLDQCHIIWQIMGGHEFAAAQLYGAADYAVTLWNQAKPK